MSHCEAELEFLPEGVEGIEEHHRIRAPAHRNDDSFPRIDQPEAPGKLPESSEKRLSDLNSSRKESRASRSTIESEPPLTATMILSPGLISLKRRVNSLNLPRNGSPAIIVLAAP